MTGGKQKVPPEKKKALKSACIAALRAIVSGADGRSRTGMEVIQRFLRPPRLPIPPHRQVYFNFPLHNPTLEFGGIWWRDMKNHRGYSIVKNPATTRVWEPPAGRKGAFAHWILSRARLPIPTLWLDLFFNANFIIVIPPRLVKSSF